MRCGFVERLLPSVAESASSAGTVKSALEVRLEHVIFGKSIGVRPKRQDPAADAGPVANAYSGDGGAREAGKSERSRHGDRGTGTADPLRLKCWSKDRGERKGVLGLPVGGAACYRRRVARQPQDGAIGSRGPQADGYALEVERV